MNDYAAINYMGLNIGTLVIIALSAVITLFAMIWGSMRRRAKAAAIAESEAHEQAILEAESDDGPKFGSVNEAEVPPEPAAMAIAPAIVPQPMAANDDAGAAGEPRQTDTGGGAYPLTTLKGLGPRAVTALAAQGIASVADLAALDPARADAIDAQLGVLAGRIARDRWVEQAKLLASGDIKGFEAAFGKLGG